MSIYRNEHYGFEIDLPEGWSISRGFHRIPLILSRIINRANILEEFSCGAHEYLNIVVESLQPEPPPDISELLFTLQAQDKKYTDVEFGRITIGDRAHAWARYTMKAKVWLKKYFIVLNGNGYAITASCADRNKLPASEKAWDGIAQSLHLLNPIDDSITALNNSLRSRRTIETMRKVLEMQIEERKKQK